MPVALSQPQGTARRYGIALLAVVIAVLLRWKLQPVIGSSLLFITFFLPVVLVALVSGAGPAVLATGLSVFAIVAWFAPALVPKAVALGVGLFCLASFLVILAARQIQQSTQRKSDARLREMESDGRKCRDDFVRAQEALRASEEFVRRLFAGSYDCIKVLDVEGNLLSMSDRGRCLMGMEDVRPYLHKPFANFWAEEDRPKIEEAMERARAGGVGDFAGYCPSVKGEPMWWDARITPIADAEGRPERLLVIARDITETKRAQELVRESEERLCLANEAGEIGTYDADVRTGRIVYSPELCSILGIPRDYVSSPQTRGWEFIHPEDRDKVQQAVTRASAPETAGVSRLELRIIRPSGEVRWVAWSAHNFFEDRPEGRVPIRSIGACIDITERKLAEEALRESEEKFRSLTESIGAAVGVVQGTRFVHANPYMAEMLGYKVDQILNMRFPKLVRPDYRRKMLDLARRRQAGEPVPANYEFPALTKNGEVRWVDFWPARTVYKGKAAIVGTGFDITRRKHVEMALRESEEKFRTLAENSKVLIAIVRDRRLLYMNPCLVEMSGYTQEELLALDIGALVREDQRELVLDRACRRQHGEALGTTYEYPMLDKSGDVHWVQLWPVQISYQGSPAILVTGIDVTARRRVEDTLRDRTRSLELLSNTATQLLMAQRPEDVLKQIFDKLAGSLDVEVCLIYFVSSEKSGLQLRFSTGVKGEALRRVEFLRFGEGVCGAVAEAGTPQVVQDVQDSSDARAEIPRLLQLKACACYPIKAHGRTVATVFFGTRRRSSVAVEEQHLIRAVADQIALAMERQALVSELERRAEELSQANRAKDNFLAILSHELRTPLTPVLATVSMLQDEFDLAEEAHDSLEVVRRNVELEARLIDDLLDLTRIARGKVTLNRSRVALCTVIDRAVEVCRPDIEARDLHFSVNTGPHAPYWVEADVGRLQQVFWNLIKNAIKFTPHGGCVGIHCWPADNGFVLAEVADSGVGIEPDALARIFDAFEQAEASHPRQFGGLGLGLAISKALVEMHGGTIEAESPGKGKGAAFRVKLPVTEPPSPSPVRRRSATSVPEKRALRILLVEDHGDTARIWKRLLERRGHEVQTAGDVATALQMASEAIDLVISDLGLPDASGLDLMRQLRDRRPELKGIALSGYGMESDVQRSLEAGFAEHLTKPVDPQTLQAAIARVAGPN